MGTSWSQSWLPGSLLYIAKHSHRFCISHSFIMQLFRLVFILTISIKSFAAFNNAWSLTNVMIASTHVNEVDLELTSSMVAGTELAMVECANQFKFDVWNCPVTAFKMNKKDAENNREAAYVDAVTSAGVAYTIARNCSRGSLDKCGCDQSLTTSGEKDWKWGGCGDNLGFGEQMSKKLLDNTKLDSLATLHNNQAGRIALRKAMKTLCKCHGVSGSCVTKTCWRQLGEFRTVGRYLKKQYKRAAKVDLSNGILKKLENHKTNNIQKTNFMKSRNRRTSVSMKEMKIKKRKLVFLHPSPDYCRLNTKLGYKGVLGKTCEVDPDSKDQTDQIRKCTNLCTSCGLQVKKMVVDFVSSCNCKFEWCCKMSCQTCHKKKILITCTSLPSQTTYLDKAMATETNLFSVRSNSI